MPVGSTQQFPVVFGEDSHTVRRMALQVLGTVGRRRQTLDAALNDIRKTQPLSRQKDRALLQAIVFGVLRWRGRIDFIIEAFSHTPLNKIQPAILDILRIALFQVMFLDRVPASAAVNTAVDLAKPLAPERVVRFVNAVLRKAAAGHRTVAFPSMDRDPIAALAISKSFPAWLICRWLRRFGPDETASLCDAVNTIPPISLRTNTLKIDPDQLRQALTDEGETVGPASTAPEGLLLRSPRKPIEDFEAFMRGWFQVQDEAAQLVSILLAPRAGERILDACAGLGGKTGHIAQLMGASGRIDALDNSASRLKALMQETQRLGMSTVRTVCGDLSSNRSPRELGPYDRVLLDAPCSGLGVLRRNPDTKWSLTESALSGYSRRQIDFLNRVAPVVKPGGVLVYGICSTEPEEGDFVVEAFLKNHPGFRLEDAAGHLPRLVGPPLTRDRFLETHPHRHGTDGFFAARFRRMA